MYILLVWERSVVIVWCKFCWRYGRVIVLEPLVFVYSGLSDCQRLGLPDLTTSSLFSLLGRNGEACRVVFIFIPFLIDFFIQRLLLLL